MDKVYKIGHNYKDILSVSKIEDQFVSWFAYKGSGIGNSGGIRSAKYISLINDLPSYIVLITRNFSHHWHNPWEDTIDFASGTIFYWGDAKTHKEKKYSDFRGNKNLIKIYENILDNKLDTVPPILHFSKVARGLVKFNGLCVLKNLELTWFEDKGIPVKNYRCELSILSTETIDISWLHDRVLCKDIKKLNHTAPKIWKDYLKGNIKKLDVWSKSILNKQDQLPQENSDEANLLKQLHDLSPTQFEGVVVELFKNLPHVHHKITRTRPTADGGFDFYGQFSIPFPVQYEIEFLGEVKKFAPDNAVQPKHVSRLVARLSRGQFGIFVTTSYYTLQTQKEVLQDGYPIKLFSGIDLVNFLKELRLIKDGLINPNWFETIIKDI